MSSWKHHVEGSAQVLQLRGRSQIRTRTGAALFRELRNNIGMNALMSETEVPDYIVQWTQALEFDPIQTPADQLTVLSARVATLRSAHRQGSRTDEELMDLANTLEKDLLSWSETTLAAGSICSFHNVHDLDSPHSWNGTRHEYGIPQAHRHWNKWRCLRIMLSRLQEAIWRRSWPTLSRPSEPVPDSEHYRMIRSRMVSDICIASAYAFGNDYNAEPPRGSMSSGYLLLMPLCLAGTCLLEQLAEPTVSPGGSRMILVDEPLHTDLFNQTSTQLAWIIERIDYINEKVGVKWAGSIGKFLKGECKIYYDLGRS